MKTINIRFNNEQEKIDFVNLCEADFESRLDKAVKEIVSSGVSSILLSGPTCSGKTTTANKLIDEFHEAGKAVTVISIDDFFKERIEARRLAKADRDFALADSIREELLSKGVVIKDTREGTVFTLA